MDKFCEDCIHNEVCQYGAIPPHIGRCNDKDTLDDLRPQGEWKVNDKIYCSECGASICDFVPNPTDAIVFILENKFCFNCGADMRKDDLEEKTDD